MAAYEFSSKRDWDRMVRSIRWSEQARRSPPDDTSPPIQPQAGVVNVRVLSRREGSAIFGDEVIGLDDPKGPYSGRIIYRNLNAQCKDDEWTDGPKCLLFPNNPDDFLGFGCVYEGYVTDEVPDPDREDRQFIPVVLVGFGLPEQTWCDCEEGKDVSGCTPCGTKAAKWFDFSLYADPDSPFAALTGEWCLKNYYVGCVWRESDLEIWTLTESGGIWTLTGTTDDDESVTFICTDFDCCSGGVFDLASSTSSWKGQTEVTIDGICQPSDYRKCGTTTTTSSTTTDDGCQGTCLFAFNGTDYDPVFSTCSNGCDCFYPTYCPKDCPYVYTFCNAVAVGRSHGKQPNCSGTTSTTTTSAGCGFNCLWLFHLDQDPQWDNIFNTCGADCACPQPDVPTPFNGMSMITDCSPSTAKCSGSCTFEWILFPLTGGGDWFPVSSGCSTYADCTCHKPSVPGTVDDEIRTVPCESPLGPPDPPDPPVPSCTAYCYFCWDGSDWQPKDTKCPSTCTCPKPTYTGTVVGEVGITRCTPPTTTTTTTTTPSTTAPPCTGGCIFLCNEPGGCLPASGQDWFLVSYTCIGTPDCGCPEGTDLTIPAAEGDFVKITCSPQATTTTSSTTPTTTSTTTVAGCAASACWARCVDTTHLGSLFWVVVDECGTLGDCYCDVGSLPSGSCTVEDEMSPAVSCLSGTTTSTTTAPGCGSCGANCVPVGDDAGVWSLINTCTDGCTCSHAILPVAGSPCTPGDETYLITACIGGPGGFTPMMPVQAQRQQAGTWMQVTRRHLSPPAVTTRSQRAVLVAATATPELHRAGRELANRTGADYRRVEDLRPCTGSAAWRLGGYLSRYGQAVFLLAIPSGQADPFTLIPPAGLLLTAELIGADNRAEFLEVPNHIPCKSDAAIEGIVTQAREAGATIREA